MAFVNRPIQDRRRRPEDRERWSKVTQEMEAEQVLATSSTKQAKRSLIPFQQGDNSTDVIINGQHYDLTTLERWQFAVYDNGTLSNSSFCYLTLPRVANDMPTIFPNGSIVNGSSCYVPFYSIGERGTIGVAFAALFGFSLMFTLICLKKHGQLFLRSSKRFRAIGRRWQWYWALFVAACAMISCFGAIDVDRFYLPSAPVVIQTLFWYLMIPGVLACVWESVRHWGSWQERQVYDADPFLHKNHDKRSQVEFYLPLVFYLFAWLNFFLNIPRNWLNFQAQADPSQVENSFIPTTHDVRFKAGAVMAFCAWCIISVHLLHSIHHYKAESRSRTLGYLRSIPLQFIITIPLSLIVIGYAEASAWVWTINLAGIKANSGWVYGLGFAPALLILYVNVFFALRKPNEDLELIRQRNLRGQATDAMLGLDRRTRKPRWWTHAANEFGFDNDAKLRALANTNLGNRRTNNEIGRDVQMHNLARQHLDDEVQPTVMVQSPFGTTTNNPNHIQPRDGLLDVTSPLPRNNIPRENSYTPSFSSETTAVSQAQRQQVRSMLDV